MIFRVGFKHKKNEVSRERDLVWKTKQRSLFSGCWCWCWCWAALLFFLAALLFFLSTRLVALRIALLFASCFFWAWAALAVLSAISSGEHWECGNDGNDDGFFHIFIYFY